jgi:integrase
VNTARLEEMTRKSYRNGWRLLKATPVLKVRMNQITGDYAEQLKFPGSAANTNCALRTLRRMLHKAEEWKMISHAPKIKMMKEHGGIFGFYCARHDYGTRVLMRTGNLAAVMKTMGHRDVKTAMHYQHPELDVVRAALDYGAASEIAEMRA